MKKNFVAVNYIHCEADYRERFEYLFSTRAGAIDHLPGFIDMQVLRPCKEGEAYLVVSYWESEKAFRAWTVSEAFLKGHQRGFADLAQAKAEGKPAPMRSDFKTYEVISQ